MSRDCDKLYSVGKFCTSLSRGSIRWRATNRERFNMQCMHWKFADIIFRSISRNLGKPFVKLQDKQWVEQLLYNMSVLNEESKTWFLSFF